jgi:hypothetical protein
MRIEIILGSWLSRYLNDSDQNKKIDYTPTSLSITCEVGISVYDLIEQCHIPIDEIGLITFNLMTIPIDSILAESGTLKFFPVLIGG